jgi:Xaa-Pro aminopeptidase
MIIQPSYSSTGEIQAKTRFLIPSFEVRRAQLLDMPLEGKTQYIAWEEHWNPYLTLLESWDAEGNGEGGEEKERKRRPKVMVDDEMRDFIQRGLGENGFEVVGLGGEVENVKQVKTEREVGILRAVNTGTVEAVRAMRGCMYLGLSEDEVKGVLDNTLRAGGLEPFFDIVLFGMSHLFPSILDLRNGYVITEKNRRKRSKPPRRNERLEGPGSNNIRAD